MAKDIIWIPKIISDTFKVLGEDLAKSEKEIFKHNFNRLKNKTTK